MQASSGIRRFLYNNYSITLVTNLAVLALGMATSIVVARSLGPVGRGEIAAVMLWPVLLSYLGNLGLPDAILYFASQKDMEMKAIYNNFIVLSFLQAIVILPLGYMVLPVLLSSQTDKVIQLSRLYLVIVFFSLISQCNTALLRARLQIGAYNLARLIIPVGYFSSVIGLWGIGNLNVSNVVRALIGLNFVSMIITTLYLLGRHRLFFSGSIDFPAMRQMVKYGLQIHLGTLFSAANLRLDQTLIAAWLPAEALGLYVIAVSSAGIFQVLPHALSIVVTPIVARVPEPSDRPEVFKQKFQQYWWLSIPFVLGLGSLLPFAIPLIYGPEFRPSIWIAEILLLAALIWGTKVMLTGGAQAMGQPLLASRAELVSSFVTIMGLVVLLPLIGIWGAAIVSVWAYAIGVIVILRGLNRKFNLSYRSLLIADRSSLDALIQRVYRGSV